MSTPIIPKLETIDEMLPADQKNAIVPAEPKEKPKKKNNGWTAEQEDLLSNWADIAACYRLLHDKTEKRFYKFNLGMTIPVIMLSTMTGTANFGMGSLFGNDQTSQRYANLAIGGVSLIAGLLTTLGNFLRFAQNMEAHRVAAVSWGKFQRSIAVELALHPKERQDSVDYIKICRAELDRLIEQSPGIPDSVIKKFEAQFVDTNIKKPDICNHLEKTYVYRTMKRKPGVAAEYDSEEDEMSTMSIVPANSVNSNPALSRIQSFVVKARSVASSPRNIIDVTGLSI
jgi:hypothetical protein